MNATTIIIAIIIAAGIAVVGCASTRSACTAEAVAPLVPRIEAAIQAKDTTALAELAVEVGADVFICAIKEHAKQSTSTSTRDGGAK